MINENNLYLIQIIVNNYNNQRGLWQINSTHHIKQTIKFTISVRDIT